jgi:hypothetical protein
MRELAGGDEERGNGGARGSVQFHDAVSFDQKRGLPIEFGKMSSKYR